MDERDDLMEDWDFDNDVLEFDPNYFPEAIKYLSTKWQRQLDHHEMHIVGEIYTWCRNNISVEEIKLLEWAVEPVSFDKNNMLHFNPIHYYEPILYLKDKWQRQLTDHEKHIIIETYDFTRTQLEAEELMFISDLWGGQSV